MLGRIPEGEQHQSVLARLARLANDRNRAQESLASQKRLLRPSDDSAAASRVISLRAQSSLASRFAENATAATEWNEFAADVLQEVSGALARTRELAIQGSNASLSSADRQALAAELGSLLEHVVQLGNTEVAGRSLFGGGAESPVLSTGSGSGANLFTYSGNPQPGSITVGQGVEVGVGVPGDEVFLSQSRRTTRYVGNTGAAAGTGSDSAVGIGSLQVAHTTTTLGDGLLAGGDSVSGLGRGASTGGDTVIGAHTIDIQDDGTVSLNGGASVAFTAADTDLRVTGPDGEAVYLDMSGVPPATPFSVAVQGDGTLSADGGTTTLAIDFSSNQVARNASDGTITQVDSSGIRQAGTDSLTYAGTFGILGTMAAIRDDLLNARGLSDTDQATELSQHLDELDDGEAAISRSYAKLGTAASRAESARESAEGLELRFDTLRSNLEDVDLAEAILAFQATEQAYEATLRATAQAQSVSLLDFLR